MRVPQTVLDCRASARGTRRRVAVLGAGVAGLVAAYELEQLGHEVRIFEGSSRVGGRIWTHRFGTEPGAPYGELGAMRIPREHSLVIHYIAELGLGDSVCKFVTIFEDSNAFIQTGGRVSRIRDAHATIEDRLARICPDVSARCGQRAQLLAGWLYLMIDAISPGQIRPLLERDLRAHLLSELEALDLRPFVDVENRTVDLHGFFDAYPGFRQRLSEPVAVFVHDLLAETQSGLIQLAGGMDQITHRLAARLRRPAVLDSEVTALALDGESVRVSWRDRTGSHDESWDYVVCTLPFSILRQIPVDGLDADKRAVVNDVVYYPATKVLLNCARPFWEDAAIRGGASFSDDTIRQAYYPSAGGAPGQQTVLLASYAIGSDAQSLDTLTDGERIEAVIRSLSRMHPELAQASMIRGAATISWGKHRWAQGGCAVPWAPSSGGARAATMSAHRERSLRPQGRLYFAGEHCSDSTAWIEASVSSALWAVTRLANAAAIR